MKKAFFPIFIDISDKKVYVIGGGKIEARRMKSLSSFAEDITVISPEICAQFEPLIAEKKITWVQKAYQPGMLKDADIVLAATDDPETNRQVEEETKRLEKEEKRQILFNRADKKENCDFYFPSLVQTEDVVIGINSGGSSPATVKEMRKVIEKTLHMTKVTKE